MQIGDLESMAIGRALAAQSHELKNVLAIVGEAAGLMEDLLELYRTQRPEGAIPAEMAARMDKALGSITAQVERGHRMTTDLNMLAHMPDRRLEHTLPDVDLGQITALACRFLERSARRCQVTLVPPPCVGVTVPADPQRCMAACMVLLEWLYLPLEPGGVIAPQPVALDPALDIDAMADLGSMPEGTARLLGAAGLSLEPCGGRLRLTLKGVSNDQRHTRVACG
ncbi:HAMP domain-containing histidine kinase [Oceanidesulfovibrio marinus]|uniref:HAMP domain-containing histidine kinase n=1 Tax=Oceanidesulfovibrio marinus TaxID=370038 RepID=A0A6P1ZAV0_9BACT|nr:HAMP domain-containing histidine kinase [Oceanidesulfovibrio marinus]QJT09635.1 HAMP domain-containing histidine kinase [Oceanidesulfovibrio marinus]TVM30997.1 hypothetical protein DQK91_19350 [Oceanidesulfovibrio marinus]